METPGNESDSRLRSLHLAHSTQQNVVFISRHIDGAASACVCVVSMVDCTVRANVFFFSLARCLRARMVHRTGLAVVELLGRLLHHKNTARPALCVASFWALGGI